MDTSPEYIKMCEKSCIESDIYQDGTWIVLKEDTYEEKEYVPFCSGTDVSFSKDGSICVISGYDDADILEKDKYFVLFTQDQLQAMIETCPLSFIDEIKRQYVDEYRDNLTWEQLWLITVMKEKFKLTWNGEDWVNA